jgi:hypothetical protein
MHAQSTPPIQGKFWTSSVSGLHSNAVREKDAVTATTQPDATNPKKEAEGVNADAKPLQFCVVGSGPAGFYTADRVGFRSGLTSNIKFSECAAYYMDAAFRRSLGIFERPLSWICYLPNPDLARTRDYQILCNFITSMLFLCSFLLSPVTIQMGPLN